MKYYVLHNPLAGRGDRVDEKLEKVKSYLDGEFVYLDLTKLTDYSEILTKLNPEDKIVISGGDGTLNRFVNSVDVDAISNDILYYASGSGNDFLNDIGGNPDGSPIKINKYLLNLPTVTVKGKEYRFINGVGYGIDGYCCQVGDEKKAKSPKPVDYTAIAIQGLLFGFKAKNATVWIDGNKYEFKKVWIAPTMNGRCYGGGMMPTPRQDRLGDGRLSFMCLYGSGKIRTLMIFPSIFKGEHVKHSDIITIYEGREITVEFDEPCALQIDGETILDVKSYTVRARK